MQIVVGELTARIGRVVYHHAAVARTVVTVEVAYIVVLAGGAVVGCEDDDGVVIDAAAFQLGDDTADVLVHAVYHGGMHLHIG